MRMTTEQVVETPVTVTNNSPIQDYVHPDDQTQIFWSNYELTQKIIEFLWLYLVCFSVLLLGFQKLGEQANISSSFR